MSNASVLAKKAKPKTKPPVGVDGRDPNLTKIFADNGIKAHVLSGTAPADREDGTHEPLYMTLDRDRKKLDFDPGSANVKLYFDKKYRQVVVVMDEKARDIERSFTTSIWASRHDSERKIRERVRARLQAGENFPVRIPGEVDYEIKSVKYLNLKEFKQPDPTPGYNAPRLTVETTIVAHCKPIKAAFLVGWDEGAMFISCLPRIARSVEAAHEMLRPKGVPKGTLRIGEFFFVQASEQMQTTLTNRYTDDGSYKEAVSIADSENHIAAMLQSYNQQEYIRALVWDDEKRHEPVWFDKWHRVYRNTEIDPPRGVDADSVD